ncbi:hypothetical protein U9M48_008481 [Paspalum notatum var. saurae]|uniref:Uncharacterized protein n=1 Tax=Paspalum notatum var. saurae TaxID=547442 RepID=A0AAQ3SP33_PASNO
MGKVAVAKAGFLGGLEARLPRGEMGQPVVGHMRRSNGAVAWERALSAFPRLVGGGTVERAFIARRHFVDLVRSRLRHRWAMASQLLLQRFNVKLAIVMFLLHFDGDLQTLCCIGDDE